MIRYNVSLSKFTGVRSIKLRPKIVPICPQKTFLVSVLSSSSLSNWMKSSCSSLANCTAATMYVLYLSSSELNIVVIYSSVCQSSLLNLAIWQRITFLVKARIERRLMQKRDTRLFHCSVNFGIKFKIKIRRDLFRLLPTKEKL